MIYALIGLAAFAASICIVARRRYVGAHSARRTA